MPDSIIQALWVQGALSPMERLCIASFLAHGHEFHLYTYGPVSGAPQGTRLCNAAEIVPASEVFQQREGFGRGSFAPFSDLFRYQLLWNRGGWWVDMDMVCVAPFTFAAERMVATCWERSGRGAVGCAMKLPPRDPLARFCLDAVARTDPASENYGDIGPRLLRRAVRELGLDDIAAPWQWFCPIGYRDADTLVRPPERHSLRRVRRWLRRRPQPQVYPSSRGIHLWNEMWRQQGISKEAVYDRRSPYEQLKSRYLPARPDSA